MSRTIEISIDMSDLENRMRNIKKNLTNAQIENAMMGVLRRVEAPIRKAVAKDVLKKYQPKSGEVKRAVKHLKQTGGFCGGIGCVIPVIGKKFDLAHASTANAFKSTGQAKGWATLPKRLGGQGKKYRVKARILNGKESVLPERLASYGGQPPFNNSAAKSLHGLVFTRLGKERFPIEKVKAIAIPQMPANRALEDVQDDIQKIVDDRIESRIQALILNGR